MTVTISVNGSTETVSEELTLEKLVQEQTGEAFDHVAVAVNDEIISRQSWDEVTFEAGDEVEIVQPIQGGTQWSCSI